MGEAIAGTEETWATFHQTLVSYLSGKWLFNPCALDDLASQSGRLLGCNIKGM